MEAPVGTASIAVLEEGTVTAEDRFVIDLSDLRDVRFECSACGAAVSFKTDKWAELPHACPGCNVQWHSGPNSPEFQTMNRLRVGLVGTLALADKLGFRLRFGLDRPRS